MSRAAARDPIYHRRRFSSETIELCVRWYITYRLSYRDLVAMMAERGTAVSHTTILRWVQRFVPEYERRWARFARPVQSSWRMDETAVLIGGRHHYIYRAVDKAGKSVESMLAASRTVEAAQAFFRAAVSAPGAGWPSKINLDKYPASHRALELLGQQDDRWRAVRVRDRRYLNNVVEQDHRAIKQRCRPMLGFKSAEHAAVTLRGIELAHRIRKHQFQLGAASAGVGETLPSLKEQWSKALTAAVPVIGSAPAVKPIMHQNSWPLPGLPARPSGGRPRRFPRKVFVDRDLYLLLWPTGARYWRFQYVYRGRRKALALGVYPHVNAEIACRKRAAAQQLLANGIDPVRAGARHAGGMFSGFDDNVDRR